MPHCALLVDDDPNTLFFLEQVLLPLGLDIIKVNDGEQALAVLRDMTPAILFLDLLLPRLSGLEVLEYVHSAPHLRAMYVVVVSAHNHYDVTDHMPPVGAYFVKPVRPKQVREAAQIAIAQQPV